MPNGGRITVRTEKTANNELDTKLDTELGAKLDTELGAKFAFSSIRDTGTGIAADIREKVFQPNFSTKTSGMGLGLAIVRKAIEEMHGHINFETVENEGTTFFIRLPLHEVDQIADS